MACPGLSTFEFEKVVSHCSPSLVAMLSWVLFLMAVVFNALFVLRLPCTVAAPAVKGAVNTYHCMIMMIVMTLDGGLAALVVGAVCTCVRAGPGRRSWMINVKHVKRCTVINMVMHSCMHGPWWSLNLPKWCWRILTFLLAYLISYWIEPIHV